MGGGTTASYTYAAVDATNGPVVTVAAAASTTSAGRYITYTGLTANTAYDVYCATATVVSASTSVTTTQASTGSYSVSSSVQLQGVSATQFNYESRLWFKSKAAAGAGSYCGSDGATACAAKDCSISSYARRRALSVTFSIAFQSKAAADSAATTLSTYMTGGTFVTDLTSCTYSSCSLSSVTGVTVTSPAVATPTSSSSSSSSSSTTTSVSGAVSAASFSLCGLVVVLLALIRL